MMKKLSIVVFVFAVLGLLFAACSSPSDSGPGGKEEEQTAGGIRDNYEFSGNTITLGFSTRWGINIFQVYDGAYFGAESAGGQIMALPEDCYFRVVFAGLELGDWPDEVIGGNNFADGFLFLSVQDYPSAAGSAHTYITLEGLGEIDEFDEGEAFMAVAQFQDFMRTNANSGQWGYYKFGYIGGGIPENNGDPYIVKENNQSYTPEGDSPYSTYDIKLEVWIPRN